MTHIDPHAGQTGAGTRIETQAPPLPPAHLPLVLVVAVAENGIIGRGGDLPWRLPSDLKRFRELTWGKPLLMGRRTFESIGKPLPGRISIVLTANPAFRAPEGVVVAHDLSSALDAADKAAAALGAHEVMVIGGDRVFAETLPLARTLHLTRVHAAPEGDVRFPAFDATQWREVAREAPVQGPRDEVPFSNTTLERVWSAAAE